MTNNLGKLTGTGCPPELAEEINNIYSDTLYTDITENPAWSVDSDGDLFQSPTYGGSIIFTRDNRGVANSAASGLSAAGSTITDATQLTKTANSVTTATAGQGVKLWAGEIGTRITVRNGSSVALLCYPPAADNTIVGQSTGAAHTINPKDTVSFVKVNSTLWFFEECKNWVINTAITAAGTTISDATQLIDIHNNVTTVTANTGVKLLDVKPGTIVTVRNGGASDLKLYPHSASASINAAGIGAAVTLTTANKQMYVLYKYGTLTWYGQVFNTA